MSLNAVEVGRCSRQCRALLRSYNRAGACRMSFAAKIFNVLLAPTAVC
jgi:hypothetical protein